MQIILLERVANLGQLGDVVRVKDGYARNFLIPQGKARRATDAALKEFEARRAELEAQQQAILADAQTRAAGMTDLEVVITAKAGNEGRLYGSVGTTEIAEALAGLGHSIEKRKVRLPDGPLRTLGRHTVELGLHAEVTASVVVVVASATAPQA